MNTAIIDYGMGNLHSVIGALTAVDTKCFIAADPIEIAEASHIILPGVGGFSEGMANLKKHGWIEPLRAAGLEHRKPFLGICLGMQMLADLGEEGGATAGLGLVPGKVLRLDQQGCSMRIPHVGWNSVHLTSESSSLLSGIPTGTDFYFVHSFAFQVRETQYQLGYTDYDIPIPAVVARANIYGTQFHPEKSSKAGSRILQNFVAMS